MSIASEIDKVAKQAINACAREIKKEIKEEAKQSVEQGFYAKYNPKIYERVYGLRSSYQEIDIGGGHSREIGVKFSPSLVSGTHKVSNSAVYEWSMVEGAHGYPGFGVYTHEAPLSFMDRKFQHTVARVPGIIQRNFGRYFN